MLVILTTHPIQYQVPIWQALARDGRVPFEVWYLTNHGVQPSHDREFAKNFAWDIELLDGYPHRFLEVAQGASPTTFWNCRLKEKLSSRLQAGNARALWVQGWQVAAYWQAVWQARKAGVEVWLRGESNDLAPTPAWKRPAKQLLLGQFFRRVDRFLYIGKANKRLYQNFGVPERCLYSAPYAVDNARFAQQAAALWGQRNKIRQQWGIRDDAFCVLFCGKFIPKKRPLDLVAAANLMKSRVAVHLLFAGSGELGGALRAQCSVAFDAEEVQNASRPLASAGKAPASFTGFLNQTEVSKAYVAADCLALPSDYGETWGLVVNEAMASGLPCVVSDRCGCAEDLAERPGSSIFGCGSSVELSQALEKITRAPSTKGADSRLPSIDETVLTTVRSYLAAAALG